MSHRHRRNPFKRSPKSPFNEDGPNATSLRRGLEWLERHDRDLPSDPTSAELRRASVKPPTESPNESVEPANSGQPTQAAPEKDNSQTDPATETKKDAAPAETTEQEKQNLEAMPATDTPTQSEPAPAETAPPQAVQPDKTQELILELTDREEADAEQREIRSAQRAPRHRGLDPRRFPRMANTIIGPVDLHRHIRRCVICQHPDREAIEEAFLQWRRPGDIRHEFRLSSRSAIYRHAHALDLFTRRTRFMRFGLENIIEESSHCVVTADSVIRAIRAHSCLDENGRWIEPPRKLIIAREVIPAPAPALPKPKDKTQIIDLVPEPPPNPGSDDPDAADPGATGAN